MAKIDITIGDIEPCIDHIKVYSISPETGDKKKMLECENENSDIQFDININSLARCIAYIGSKGDSTLRTFWKKVLKDNIDILDNDIFIIARTALEASLETLERGGSSYYQVKATIELLKEFDDKYCY